MREAEETTRQRLATVLRDGDGTPSELAVELEVPPHVVVDHVQHVARSLEETDEQLLVAPPTCRDCGFDGFDEPANLPSRCPTCKSESIAEPAFTIE